MDKKVLQQAIKIVVDASKASAERQATKERMEVAQRDARRADVIVSRNHIRLQE